MPSRYQARWSVFALIALGTAMLPSSVGCYQESPAVRQYHGAIQSYYNAHPACLWENPVHLPASVASSDQWVVRGLDSLVHQGLLIRGEGSHNKSMISYDLTPAGRDAWTVDASHPGYGNFCYGSRKVIRVRAEWTAAGSGAHQVDYVYDFDDPPPWARSAEVQHAFWTLWVDLDSPLTSVATIAPAADGWRLVSDPKPERSPETSPNA